MPDDHNTGASSHWAASRVLRPPRGEGHTALERARLERGLEIRVGASLGVLCSLENKVNVQSGTRFRQYICAICARMIF